MLAIYRMPNSSGLPDIIKSARSLKLLKLNCAQCNEGHELSFNPNLAIQCLELDAFLQYFVHTKVFLFKTQCQIHLDDMFLVY